MGIPYNRFSCFQSETIRNALIALDDKFVELEKQAAEGEKLKGHIKIMFAPLERAEKNNA